MLIILAAFITLISIMFQKHPDHQLPQIFYVLTLSLFYSFIFIEKLFIFLLFSAFIYPQYNICNSNSQDSEQQQIQYILFAIPLLLVSFFIAILSILFARTYNPDSSLPSNFQTYTYSFINLFFKLILLSLLLYDPQVTIC